MTKTTTRKDIELEYLWLNSMITTSCDIKKEDLMNISKAIQDMKNERYSQSEVNKLINEKIEYCSEVLLESHKKVIDQLRKELARIRPNDEIYQIALDKIFDKFSQSKEVKHE